MLTGSLKHTEFRNIGFDQSFLGISVRSVARLFPLPKSSNGISESTREKNLSSKCLLYSQHEKQIFLFRCEFCEKRFAAASNLSEHRTLHTGRLPYSCAGCGKKFRLWTSLKKHSVKCSGEKAKDNDLGEGELEKAESTV